MKNIIKILVFLISVITYAQVQPVNYYQQFNKVNEANENDSIQVLVRTVGNPDHNIMKYVNASDIGGGDGIQSIVPGDNISVNNTDPQNPVVSSTGDTPTLAEVLAEGNIADRDIKSVGARGEITLSSNTGSLGIDQTNVDGHEIQNSLGLANSPALIYLNQTLARTSQIYYDADNYHWIIYHSGILGFKGLVGSSYFGANYTDNTYVQKKYVDDFYTTITGYDAGATQTLKHVNGVLQWVTD